MAATRAVRDAGELADLLGVRPDARVRPRVLDPTLGVDVAPRPPRRHAHRLVAVGDSLTHGFQNLSGAGSRHSWPVLLAELLGTSLAHPVDDGPGGHPLDLEQLLRRWDGGGARGWWRAVRYALEVDRWYTTPPGDRPPDPRGPRAENLAVWGWDLRDALSRSAATEEREVVGRPLGRRLLARLAPFVDESRARTGLHVLNSSRDGAGRALSPLAAARRLGEDPGGVEVLSVWLGSNNVLRSVVELRTVPSDERFRDLDGKRATTVWTVAHFRAELAEVERAVRAVDADHVVWGTVPHVTIPPVSHGLGGPLPGCPRYFRHYARPWTSEASFDPAVDAHLTGEQAHVLDAAVDAYSRAVVEVVERARRDGLDWRVVDVGALLDRIAYRRNVELGARPDGVDPLELPAAIADLDTRFFRTDAAGRRTQGGLVGLDGVHPSTSAVGLVVQEFADVLAGAGVGFARGHAVDFAALRARDTLVSDPPPGTADVLALLDRWDQRSDAVRRWWRARGGRPVAGP